MVLTPIRTSADLEAYLKDKNISWDEAVLPSRVFIDTVFPLRIPHFYADLVDWKNINDPLRRMVIPEPEEENVQGYELADPIGDHTHEPVAGLVHRYRDRCLLLLTTHCSVHCRFCFRRDVIGTPLPIDLKGIESYLKAHDEIHEVIFTGGDPAALSPVFLSHMLGQLSLISHIDTYRFHTRTMIVDPTSVSQEWLLELQNVRDKRKVVVLHVDHPHEITTELQVLVKKLQKMDVLVLSQSVLLRGVNDTRSTLTRLFQDLVRIGIAPYYLHHLDKARGTHHFRLSIEEGKKIYSSLRGTIPGYTIPTYVVDLPGGDGKVPVMAMRRIDKNGYEVENFEGKTIRYTDPLGDKT